MAVNMPKLPFKLPAINLGPRTRKILRYVGLGFFALIVFVFALQMTFPYDRVKEKAIEAMSDKYDVTIGKVERGWMPGRVYFKAVNIRPRPTKPDETVTPFYIDELEVDVGILSLIGGTISVDLDARIGDRKVGFGNLEGTLEIEKFGRGNISASFTGNSLPGDALPMRQFIGLPLTGKLQFSVNLQLPMEKSKLGKTAINWQKARGGLSLQCPSNCTFGDGKTKLKPLLKNTRNQVMVGEGIDFGKVTMDSLLAKVTIKGGKLTLDKFEAASRDGQLKVDYMMTLEKEFGESMVAGCLRFKGSDDLLRREPKTHAAISTTGAELRGDGLFHIRLTDRFKDMKRLNQECGPGTNTGMGENFSGKSDRPNLTIQPDESARPAVTPPPTPAPEAPPPPPATPPAQDAGAAGTATGTATPPPPPGAPGGPPAGSAQHTDGKEQPGSAGQPPPANTEGPPPGQREAPSQ